MVDAPSEEDIARAIFDSDYRSGDFDEDKAMAIREGIKWPSHSKLQYFKYARAVLALLRTRTHSSPQQSGEA